MQVMTHKEVNEMELKKELEKIEKERQQLLNQLAEIQTKIIRREGIIIFLKKKIEDNKVLEKGV